MTTYALSATFIALALSTPAHAANCFIDQFGNERCRLSTGARIAIAIAVFVGFVVLLSGLSFYRRRRIQQANLAYVNTNPNNFPNSGYGGYGVNGAGAYATSPPQYPPQTHWGGGPVGGDYGAYNPQSGFAPPAGPPPSGKGGYAPYDVGSGAGAPPPDYASSPYASSPYAPPPGPPPAVNQSQRPHENPQQA